MIVVMPTNTTTQRTGMAIETDVRPKPSAWATSARAITAPERMARKMVTRLSDSVYVSERVASRLQCSVARICSFAASSVRLDGGSSVGTFYLLVAGRRPLLVCDPATLHNHLDAIRRA